jgi:hypothetical protein
MADEPVVHIGENSPEQVALKLFYEVARSEKKDTGRTTGDDKPDRKWILDTFAECMNAVRVPQGRIDYSASKSKSG